MAYGGNNPPQLVSYGYVKSVYGGTLPEIVSLIGEGYRIWEFNFGYGNLSYLSPGFFASSSQFGSMARGDLIFINGLPTPAAVVVIMAPPGGNVVVSADVLGYFASKTDPVDPSPSYGTLITDWNPSGSVTFGGVGVQGDSTPCPDKASLNMLTAQYPGVTVDPSGNSTVAGLAIPCNTVENIVVWMKGTVRAGDAIATAYPFLCYLGVGGFTKLATITGLLPADGNWHALILNVGNFSTSGGFSFSSTDLITTVRIKPTDPSQNGTVGYNTVTTGEVNIAGPVRMNPRARAKFVIRFDDSIGDLVQPVSTNTFALPDGTQAPAGGWSALSLLSHYGFRGSCFHLPRRIGTSNNMVTHATWDDLKVLKRNGWANCFQSYYDPANSTNDGIRLLGPTGFASKAVASVDTSAETITASAPTGILIAGAYYGGYPVIFSGTNLPAPLIINKIYWAIGVNTTTFKLYSTEQDAINQNNPINFTTTGTPANFTFRYGFSANDYTKYTDDWYLGMKLLADNGYADDAKFLALNQGATDGNVMTLAVQAGIKAVFGTYRASDSTFFMANYPFTENGGTNPALNWKEIMRIPGTLQTDTAGLVSTDQARAYVDKVVAQGSWGMNFHHRITNANGPCLAAMLDQLKKQSDAGLIDVITAPELPLA